MSNARVSADDEMRKARLAAVRARFEASGTVAVDWAREHGFKVNMVHQVLAGRGKWKRGETHRIAVALGLKDAAPPPGVTPPSSKSAVGAEHLEGFTP